MRAANLWPGLIKWIPPLGLLMAALGVGPLVDAWVWMWLIALSIFFAAKWITVRKLLSGGSAPTARLAAYCFLWPGMDAPAFSGPTALRRPAGQEWGVALSNTLMGAALVWFGVRRVFPRNPSLAAWVGMIGVVLLLHFGLFHLLSTIWRNVGINAQPLMNSPITANSHGKFWSGRWNTAFSDLMNGVFFIPFARRFGTRGAILAIFLISGLLHELVISVPARAGYGLPTLYFLIQAVGLLFERSKPGVWLGLSSGFSGRAFTLLVTCLPVVWLFHPTFIRGVMIPMFRAMGAL